MKNVNTCIAIWLDTKQANIFTLDNRTIYVQTIKSEIENFHPAGGSRSKTAWGPMEKMSEKKYLERKKHQIQKYFDAIIAEVKGARQLYLFDYHL